MTNNSINSDKLELFREIWQRLHSDEFLDLSFEQELREFEHIIINKLTFCSCGQDAHFILTFMLETFRAKPSIDFGERRTRENFWILFHNHIRLKLSQPVIFTRSN